MCKKKCLSRKPRKKADQAVCNCEDCFMERKVKAARECLEKHPLPDWILKRLTGKPNASRLH